MRKLIFIWFVLFGMLAVAGAIWTGRSIRQASSNSYESDMIRFAAKAAATALHRDGVPALDEIERDIDPQGRLRFFVFDAGSREISGKQVPESVHAMAGRLRPGDNIQFEVAGGGLLAGSSVSTNDGAAYRVVVRFPARRAASVPVFAWAWAGRIAVIVVVAALICLWLAWRLSMPLDRLRQAARQFAAGDLKARAGAESFPRAPPEYRELAHDFDDMAARIETLVDSQRQLLRDVSHELRTPLTRLALVVDHARHAPVPSVLSSLDRIDQESERLNALLDRIIRLSRCESFAEPPHRDPIDFGDFVESIVSDADFEASARRRRVSIVRAETCKIVGDRELLREAIENIVRNAIRYTPEGTAVLVDAWREGNSEYRIVVQDSGPGVPAEHMAAIFDPFYRAPQRRGPDSAGFGIGLAIAKRAISLHKGTIAARNRIEGGFEIAIGLPVSAAA